MSARVDRRLPYPEFLGRDDADPGASPWTVHAVPMLPGFARTVPTDREMWIPVGDTEQERVVRAHELMHARVSPVETWGAWLERGFASEAALRAAEELRVNELCRRQGFDVRHALRDGSERYNGERIGFEQQWREGVLLAAAFAGTARATPFIAGVRKHNPEWAASFRELTKGLVARARSVRTSLLAATCSDPLAPSGFAYAEKWAVLLDLISQPTAVVRSSSTPVNGDAPLGTGNAPPPFDAAAIRRMVDRRGPGLRNPRLVPWVPLVVGRAVLDRHAPGRIGRDRSSSNRGRHPRRIDRALTDPQRRIFDMRTRGAGGVVLVDRSGSMRFEPHDIQAILDAAPGCTVAGYSAITKGDPDPNLWVVAEHGRVASRLPKTPGGNGCDGPALDWAIAQRQHPSAPIVWVCDGLVTGEGDLLSDALTLECIDKVRRHRIVIVPHVREAIAALKALQVGREPVRWTPPPFQALWTTIAGEELHLGSH